MVSWCWCVLQFCGHFCCSYAFGNTCFAFGRCYCLCCLILWEMLQPPGCCCTCYFVSGRCCNHQADVIACIYYLCLVDVYHILLWLMLLPLFVIVVILRMADFIARVADDVATDCNCCMWQMLLSRWLMLLPLFVVVLLAGVIAKWLMLLPLIIIIVIRQMLLPKWLMLCHCFDSSLADVVAKVVDGIAYHGCGVWQML